MDLILILVGSNLLEVLLAIFSESATVKAPSNYSMLVGFPNYPLAPSYSKEQNRFRRLLFIC